MPQISFALLLDGALKGTLVLMAATAVTLMLRRNSAASRHLVWQLALLGVLGLPLLKVVSPFKLELLPQLRSPIVTPQAAPEAAAPVFTQAMAEQVPTSSEQTAATPAESPAPAQSGVPLMLRIVAWIGIAWLAVTLGLLVRLALGFVLVRWFALRAYPLYEDGWAELNAELCALVGLKRPVTLYASPHIATPMTWGIVSPVVMLPGSAEDWTMERKRIVMLHELAHIRRRDSLTHMFAQLACAVYWFHPLVWRAAARMRAEAERACDDLVLRTGTKASVYADHLLELIRTIGNMRTPALALPMAQRSTFEGRLLAILEPHLDRTAPRPLSVAGMVMVVGLVVFPLAGLTTASAISTEAGRASGEIGKVDLKAADDIGATFSQVGDQIAAGAAEVSTKSVEENLERGSEEVQQQRASSAAIQPLIRALGDTDADVRLASAQSLGQMEDSTAVVALSNALRTDSDARVRRMAAWALGNIESEDGVPALVHALKNDRDVEVRRTVVWALGQIEESEAVPALVEALRDSDQEVRTNAVWALGQIEDKAAVPALSQIVRTGDPKTRKQAAWALGQIEDASAVPALTAALRDDSEDVRTQAVWALGQIEAEDAVGALANLRNDANPQTRKQVAWALGQIESDQAVPALSQMAREDKADEVRQTAVWALGQIESAAGVPAVSAALKDAVPGVRSQAAWALGQIEARPVPPALLEALKDNDKNVRATAAWAIAQIEDPAAGPALRAAMRDSDPAVRKAVLNALIAIGDEAGFSALAEMLKDPDPEVRRAAAAAMGGRNWHVDPRPQPQPQPRPQPRPIN